MFFDACDGIFLNYNWKDETMHRSLTLAKHKGREMDVYVGIDVFGRGCLGGGGYNTVEVMKPTVCVRITHRGAQESQILVIVYIPVCALYYSMTKWIFKG
jgi:hypothetical protein